MKSNKELKRQLIEKEIHSIVLSDSRAILADNLMRRKKRLGNISVGDTVLVFEFLHNKRKKDASFEGEFLYRLTEGTVKQVTNSGFLIDGVGHTGKKIIEFVNKAHIINGTIQLLLKEKRIQK